MRQKPPEQSQQPSPEGNQNLVLETTLVDKVVRRGLVPFLLGIVIVASFWGVPYPVIPIGIVALVYCLSSSLIDRFLKGAPSPSKAYLWQPTLNLILIAVVIHLTGGIESFVAPLFGVSLIMVGLVLPLKPSLYIAVLGSALYLGVLGLEYLELIPHRHLLTSFSPDAYQDLGHLLIFGLGAGGGFLTIAFISGYLSCRLREALDNYARLKDELEDRMRREIRDVEPVQDQLVQAEKMVALGELSAGVAHELNTPLGVILGYAQYALEKLKSKDASCLTPQDMTDYASYLSYIAQQAEQSRSIVQNLLKFSRSSPLQFEPLDITLVMEETLLLTKRQLDEGNVRLIKKLERGLPPVKGNAALLQQVFTNIVLNAQQAMPEGGELVVASRYVNDGSSGQVEALFTDSGCGIPPENLAKIFQPFFTTKRVGQGTGLGLSLSYGIVKEHQGEIRVESTVGQGTTFTISLPVAATPEIGEPKGGENRPGPFSMVA